MIANKKNIHIAIAAVICIFIFCALVKLISAENTSPTYQSENEPHSHFFGTYQKNSLNDAQYIAVIPSSSDKGGFGSFQWYNINNMILQEDVYRIYKNNYMIFYVDGKRTAVITNQNGHYFFSDGSTPQELRKISEEAIVCRPVGR